MARKSYVGDIIALRAEQIMQKFKSGEFPDKTFSKLYAKYLNISTRPGLILDIKDKKIYQCYCITQETEDFLTFHDKYAFLFDFRADFRGLEKWMKESKKRPRPYYCSKKDIPKQIKESIKRGSDFTNRFFVIIVPQAPRYPFAVSIIDGKYTYVEFSNHFDAIHGSKDTSMSIIKEKKVVYNENKLSYDCLTKISRITKDYTKIIGVNTMCEFFIIDNMPCLISSQRRSQKKVSLCLPQFERTKQISQGPICGTIKYINKMTLPETIKQLSQTDKEYVFLAKRPNSEFVELLKFSNGFIFEEGGLLCHLAILLREKGISARIIQNSTLKFRDGEKIALK
ncbi:MAG: PEP-utilizing enzyme [Candidatus Methanofastidiosia archaeon]|jgi:phosphohistidine swiveling domain-containing protein